MLFCTVSGNLGKAAELKQTNGGELCKFSIASNTKVKGEKVTTWVDCSIFGKRGAALVQYLTKGTRVVAVGALSTRVYEGKTYLQLNVQEIELMGGGERGGSSSGGGGSSGGSKTAGGGYDDADYGGSAADDPDLPF